VRQDNQVRDGVLRALDRRHELRRSNAGLAAGRADEQPDSNVRSVLTKLAQTDQNASIRSQSADDEGADAGEWIRNGRWSIVVGRW